MKRALFFCLLLASSIGWAQNTQVKGRILDQDNTYYLEFNLSAIRWGY